MFICLNYFLFILNYSLLLIGLEKGILEVLYDFFNFVFYFFIFSLFVNNMD